MSRLKNIFVYGTLKRGGTNHSFLIGQQFLGEARTAAGFVLYALGDYPGMVRDAKAVEGVTGEVWAVDAACLAELDELEGLKEGLYERIPIELLPPFAGQSVETYLYLKSVSGAPLLGSSFTI